VSTSPLLEQISQEEEDEEEEDDDNANTYNVEDPPFLSTDAIVPFDPTKSYTPKQLRSMVTAVLPANGGRIEQLKSSSSKTSSRRKVKYAVYDRHGQLKRIMLVNKEGRVFEEIQSENGDDDDDDSLYEEEANSIKLGLGDFIFYSVMVGKAAQYSFTTFIACLLVILAGLGGTLVLLSVYRQALPALPISIFLGVGFYLLTRYCIEPWVMEVLSMPYYV